MNGWISEWMGDWADELLDRWKSGWIDGWIDRRTDRQRGPHIDVRRHFYTHREMERGGKQRGRVDSSIICSQRVLQFGYAP